MKILFKFPTRSRPEKFFATLNNIIENLTDLESYQISATVDSNDHTMNTPEIIERTSKLGVKMDWGYSRGKIDACNRNVDMSYSWDILVLMSDDMWFLKKGFDEEIREDFRRNGLDRLIHYHDGHATGLIVSIPVMGREYYNTYNYIYHPAYVSLFCDDELFAVASRTGKLIMSPRKIVEHRHHTWGFGESDAQLKHTESFYHIDYATFQRRKRQNFFIK